MLERMLPEEFMEWRAAYLNEPWGDDWQQAGTVAAVAYNIGAALGGAELQTPEHFIPKLFETTEERERREMAERLRGEADQQRSRHDSRTL